MQRFETRPVAPTSQIIGIWDYGDKLHPWNDNPGWVSHEDHGAVLFTTNEYAEAICQLLNQLDGERG